MQVKGLAFALGSLNSHTGALHGGVDNTRGGAFDNAATAIKGV
jgi:hypothetical protein